ncbi:MAG: phage integrase central domain-containing protein [Acidimicrobiia bacterium]
MAHIERRESGRWRARYRAPDGRERSKTLARKVDAQRFLAGVETDKSRGEWIDPRLGRTRFDEFAHRWMSAIAPTLKPKTVTTYQSLLRSRVQPAFGDWAMASIRPSDVQAWVGAMIGEGLSPSRVRQAHVVLSLVLKAAAREGVVARNVADGARASRSWHGRRRHISTRQRSTASLQRCLSPMTCWSGSSGRSAPGGVRRPPCVAARSTSCADG